MRSASAARLVVTVLGVTALAGCATTQQEATRLQLNSARIRATEEPVRIVRSDPAVAVEGVTLVRDAPNAAIVVELHNRQAGPVSDLPISVGVTAGAHRRIYLNAARGLDYFRAHIPGIAGGGSLTWMFTTGRRLPPAARAFALVGAPTMSAGRIGRQLPCVAVVAGPHRGQTIWLTVRNDSEVPQYQLQVYAAASRRGRFFAAGTAAIAHLGTGSSTQVSITLLGPSNARSLALEAPPTIFG